MKVTQHEEGKWFYGIIPGVCVYLFLSLSSTTVDAMSYVPLAITQSGAPPAMPPPLRAS